MSDSLQTTVICQDPADGSKDVIIDLHPDVLATMSVGLDDSLSIELVDGSILLKQIHDTNTQP
ncbi:AbrB/MazE/SpoVT family DNA-binding domain-containing protein [Pseudomonas tolaasii]